MKRTVQNYHNHKWYSNILVPDCATSIKQYAERCKEIGSQVLCSMEHGFQGNYFETYEVAKEYGLKFVYGTEAYWVKDRHSKDKLRNHMVILAKNNNGRKALNLALSEANVSGYYYIPRMDLELILSLPKDDVFITSACGFFWKYDDIDDIVLRLHDHFGDNFMLEVQYHNTDKQIEINKHILELSQKYGIQMILGMDSHYIYPEQASNREEVLLSKGIKYAEEEGWYMDFPDYDETVKRLKHHDLFTDEQIEKMIDNTNLLLEFGDYDDIEIFNMDKIKLPTLYPELTQEERDYKLKEILTKSWIEYRKNQLNDDEYKYKEEIKKEVKTIIDTKMADYFLIDYEIVKDAVANGGQITPSGRGSGVSNFTNTLFGFSKIDRISAPVKMFPERFMSTSRILESGSIPDLDLNLGNPEVFIESQKRIFGDSHAYPMIAYGTFKAKSAWKMYAKAEGIDFTISNNISSQIGKYEDALKYADDDEKDMIDIYEYIDSKYHKLYDESKAYQGIISDKKPHPCFVAGTKVLTEIGYKNIEDIQIGDMVMTHNNRFREVENVMNHTTDDIYTLRVTNEPIIVTGSHPMYVISQSRINHKKDNGKWTTIKQYSEPYWKDVRQLDKNDKVGFAINQESKIPQGSLPFNDENFWWVIGRYIGDGWYEDVKNRTEKRLIICCNKANNETSDIINKLEGLFPYRITSERTVNKVFIKSRELFEYVKANFGKYAHNKHLTQEVHDLPVNLLKSMLEGYFSADGCLWDNNMRFTTVSQDLALDMQMAIHKAYGRPCSIFTREKGIDVIEGRKVNRRKQYIGSFTLDKRKKDRNIKIGNHIWMSVKSVKKIDITDTVYNMSVKEDHTYTVNNHIAHNCAHLIYDKDIREEIGLIRVKSENSKKSTIVCLMDGLSAEKFKFLKNDLLKVDVVSFFYKIAEKIGQPLPTEKQLIDLCEGNDKVWDIYSKGLTLGVNQIEKYNTKIKAMKYKPKNISELCAFIAGIRPSFKSMYPIFESREYFEYGIPTFDKIIQSTGLDSSFILYQETIMAVLEFAGFQSDKTYDIIKAISKKRLKKIKAIKPKFIANFEKAIIENDGMTESQAHEASNKVWEIIENSSQYGFNASHSYSYAFDSLLCAYYKSHYTLEFYETLLQEYSKKGKKDKVAMLKEEAINGFGIEIRDIKFGEDNTDFKISSDRTAINQSILSIKNMNQKISQQLLELSKKEYIDFTELLRDIKNKTNVQSNHLDILIKLNYFRDFGTSKKILKYVELYDNLYGRKQFSTKDKDSFKKIYGVGYSFLSKYCTLSDSGKTLQNFDYDSCLDFIWNNLKDTEYAEIVKIKFDVELMGYTTRVEPTLHDFYIVLDVEKKNKHPMITIRDITNGCTKKVKCKIHDYNKAQMSKTDVIKVFSIRDEGRWKMSEDKRTEDNPDGWYQDWNDKEPILKKYSIVKFEEDK